MGRWSPTVAPAVLAPLDFSPISDTLRDVRAERERERQRQREKEQDRLAAEARERDVRLAGGESAEEYEARQPVGGADMDRALHQPFELGVTSREAGDPGVRPVTIQRPEDRERDELEDVAGGRLPVTRVPVNGREFVIDPMRQLALSRAQRRTEYAAREEGEATGSYAAARRAGVPEATAQRWAFGPKGLTMEERSQLGQQQGDRQMALETYRWGERRELQTRREQAALRLLRARQQGDLALARQYAGELKAAEMELDAADKRTGFALNLIPKDPLVLRQMETDEAWRPLLDEARSWLGQQLGPEGGRERLVQQAVGAAHDAARAKGGKKPDARRLVTPEEWDAMMEDAATPEARARIRAKYRVPQ